MLSVAACCWPATPDIIRRHCFGLVNYFDHDYSVEPNFTRRGPRALAGLQSVLSLKGLGLRSVWPVHRDPGSVRLDSSGGRVQRQHGGGRGHMDREQLRATLLQFLQEEMGEDFPSLTDEVRLKDGLNLDSVDVIGLVMKIERELRIRLSMNDLEEVRTVGDLLDLLLATGEGAKRRVGVAARAPESNAA
jgi:acyl carrier protein